MDSIKKLFFVLFFAALGIITSGSALAHGGKVRFSVFVGAPFYQPYYYQHYYQEVIVVPAPQPPVYIQQTVPAPTQFQGGDWYYCAGSRAYYPYVRECPGGWQRVPSQPPR